MYCRSDTDWRLRRFPHDFYANWFSVPASQKNSRVAARLLINCGKPRVVPAILMYRHHKIAARFGRI